MMLSTHFREIFGKYACNTCTSTNKKNPAYMTIPFKQRLFLYLENRYLDYHELLEGEF